MKEEIQGTIKPSKKIEDLAQDCIEKAKDPGKPPKIHKVAVVALLVLIALSPAQEVIRIETAKLIQAVPVKIPYGTITWPKGTQVRILAHQDKEVFVEAHAQQIWIEKTLLEDLKEENMIAPPKLVAILPKAVIAPPKIIAKPLETVAVPCFVGIPTSRENPLAINPQFELDVLTLTNEGREAQGLSPLVLDDSLSRAARYHAQDMSKDNYYKHDTYDRTNRGLRAITTLAKRLRAFAETPQRVGENIHSGVTTPKKAVDDWMKSPGHRRNILNPTFTRIGIGYCNNYWVQVLSSDPAPTPN